MHQAPHLARAEGAVVECCSSFQRSLRHQTASRCQLIVACREAFRGHISLDAAQENEYQNILLISHATATTKRRRKDSVGTECSSCQVTITPERQHRRTPLLCARPAKGPARLGHAVPERALLWAAGWDPVICVYLCLELDGRLSGGGSWSYTCWLGAFTSWDRTEQENNQTYTPSRISPLCSPAIRGRSSSLGSCRCIPVVLSRHLRSHCTCSHPSRGPSRCAVFSHVHSFYNIR